MRYLGLTSVNTALLKYVLMKDSWLILVMILRPSDRATPQVVVHAGCRGTVLAEFSDTRLTVVFETSEDSPSCFNVLPLLGWHLIASENET